MYCQRCGAGNPPGARFCAGCGELVKAGGRTNKALIVALAVGGGAFVLLTGGSIIAAIAIPNLLNAIDRGKQKRTMADIRSIGTAIEEYSIDNDTYPVVRGMYELAPLIEPHYLREAPRVDAWGGSFIVRSDGDSYELISPGKDGQTSGCRGGATSTFTADICFANGRFTQWPEGQQH